MKLFGFFAASALAYRRNGDRTWANRPDFIMTTEDWWNADVGTERLSDMKRVVNEYFAAYTENSSDGNVERVGRKNKHLLNQTLNQMETQRAKCGGRKRRDANQRGYELDTTGHQEAINSIFWTMAKWTRNELWECRPKQTLKILKRLDRLMRIYFWQTCRLGMTDGGYCSWAWNPNNVVNPRKTKWLDDLYGKDTNQFFQMRGCSPTLVCPLGGTITITKVEYNNNQLDISGAQTACDGEETCTFTRVDDSCTEADDRKAVTKYTCSD